MSFTLKIEKNTTNETTVDEVQYVKITTYPEEQDAAEKRNQMLPDETPVSYTTMQAVVQWKDMHGDIVEVAVHGKTNVYVVNENGVTVNTYRTL